MTKLFVLIVSGLFLSLSLTSIAQTTSNEETVLKPTSDSMGPENNATKSMTSKGKSEEKQKMEEVETWEENKKGGSTSPSTEEDTSGY